MAHGVKDLALFLLWLWLLLWSQVQSLTQGLHYVSMAKKKKKPEGATMNSEMLSQVLHPMETPMKL